MQTPRWLAALLVAALLLSSAPASVLAAPIAPASQQAPPVASTPSYLLVVTPPAVALPAQARGFDAAGYVNIQHARRYAEVQAQLEMLQAQGAIAGFTEMPSAYAFVVTNPNAAAQAALAPLGRMQTAGNLSAASVDELGSIYQRQLLAAITANGQRQPHTDPAQQPPLPARPLPQRPQGPDNPPSLMTGAPAAADDLTPTFTLFLYDHRFDGNMLEPGTNVTYRLKAASGVTKVAGSLTADSSGAVSADLYDIYGFTANIEPDDVLEVQTPGLITIPAVFLQAIADVGAGRVTGSGPPDITSTDPATWPNLELAAPGGGFVTTTASGAWSAENVAVMSGYVYSLIYTNEQGNRIVLKWNTPSLAARGYHYGWHSGGYIGPSLVSGIVPSPNARVTVTLTRPAVPPFINFAQSAGDGSFALNLSDLYDNWVSILAGDTLQASDGVVTMTLAIKSFVVTSDPSTSTVSGTTDAAVVTDTVGLPQTLSLWPIGATVDAPGKTVPAADGSFSAANPFYWYADAGQSPSGAAWLPGQEGFLRYLDAQGNPVFDSFRAVSPAPTLYLRGNDSSYIGDDRVTGYAAGYCGQGIVTLLDAANAIKDQDTIFACPSFSHSFADVYDSPVPILDGDSVTVNLDGLTALVQAPSLTLRADPQTDVVTGTITPGLVLTTTFGMPQSLAVYGDNFSGFAQNVQPDASGNFSAGFAGMVDIAPGARGFVRYIDAQGNSVYAAWQAPLDKPMLSLRGFQGYRAENLVVVSLLGYSCSNERGIDLVVKAQDGGVRWQDTLPVCGSVVERYLADDFGNDINLNPGDVVQVAFRGQTAAATVPSFDVLSYAPSEIISGVTNATVVTTTAGLPQTLAVWPDSTYDDDYGKHVTLAAGGVFSATNPFYYAANPANWEINANWDAGAQGHLRYIDAAGNSVYATFAAPVDQTLLSIQKDGNRVSGQMPVDNAPVTVTVRSSATVKGIGYATSTLAGNFSLDIFDAAGNPLLIAEGDEVLLAQPAIAVTVPPLSADVDVENDRISGKGPANALIHVYYYDAFYSFSRSVVTGANGDYMLDLRGVVDLHDGILVGVEYKNAEGHRFWRERPAGTTIAAVLNTNRVWGHAPERQLPVTVTVKRDGTVIAAASFVNDDDYFTAFPIDASGKPVVLATGDVVELDLGAGVARSLTLAALSLAVDEQANVVSGMGPANSLLGLTVEALPDGYFASVPTDSGGQWSADLAARLYDIRPGAVASLRYSTNGSDTTWLYGIAPVFWLRKSNSNEIEGYAAPHAPVTIMLKRNGVVLATAYTEASDEGWYDRDFYDVNGLPANIQAGDVVEVKSTQTVSVTVPVLSITVDGPARTVSGLGPANAALGLLVFSNSGFPFSQTVHTDAGGAFFASFTADTQPDLNYVIVRYREAQGNWIYAGSSHLTGGASYLRARWDSYNYEYAPYAVSGRTGASPRQVLLALQRAGQVVATASAWATAPYGDFTAFFYDAAGEYVDILGGDGIEMTAGDVARSMTVPTLTAQVNSESQTLFGIGPADTRLISNSCGITTVDAGGAWVIDCDHEPDPSGYVSVTDLMGNTTYLAWNTPHVSVREYGSEVEGATTLAAAVQVQLLRSGAVIAEASDDADAANGWFEVQFPSAGGSPLIIQPNDVVVVKAGQSITVPVTPLTAVIDPAGDKITGIGAAEGELEVYASTNTAGVTRRVTAAMDGRYVADFGGAADIRPGDWIDVSYINASGNKVWLGWYAPLVRINLGSDIVDGYATPNAAAALVLKRSGDVIATTQVQTGADGEFSAFFLDAFGSLFALEAGDVVEVTASPAVAVRAAALSAAVDMLNDTVAGTGPAGAPILVVAYHCHADGCNNARLTAVADEAGAYIADFAGVMDLDQTSYAYVQAADTAGNQTSLTAEYADTPQRTYVEGKILAAGASLLISAVGTANGGDLTPPLALQAVGSGRFIFYASGGNLVVTSPDGAITRADSDYYVIDNPATGTWKVQVEAWGGLGRQYAVAAGAVQHKIYMPTIHRQ